MVYLDLNDNLSYDIKSGTFNKVISKDQVFKFLKGKYRSLPVFKRDFCNEGHEYHDILKSKVVGEAFLNDFLEMFNDIKPFTYKEAFKLEDPQFRANVFGTVDIGEMIENLGKKKIASAEKTVKRKQFDGEGNFLGWKEYGVLYRTYEVSGEKLELRTNIYAIQCWCTSTEEEHWIWIEEKYKDNPLEAIASTFRIAKNLIPHIKELKRQGDIIIVELKEEIEPEGEVVPLTAEQYFGLLTAES